MKMKLQYVHTLDWKDVDGQKLSSMNDKTQQLSGKHLTYRLILHSSCQKIEARAVQWELKTYTYLLRK